MKDHEIPNPDQYATLVFDCDGVVLDSNRVKTEAFRQAALPWGTVPAEALVAHHVAHGGVSRYAKFAHFLDHILPQHAPDAVPGRDGPDLQALLDTYAGAVREGLLTCAVADGLAELRAATPQSRWMIVSGGDQAELRDIFALRDLASLFDGGIFGSPDSKDTILDRELENGNIMQPAVFLGDSQYDFDASRRANIEFLFVSQWSEWNEGSVFREYYRFSEILSMKSLIS